MTPTTLVVMTRSGAIDRIVYSDSAAESRIALSRIHPCDVARSIGQSLMSLALIRPLIRNGADGGICWHRLVFHL